MSGNRRPDQSRVGRQRKWLSSEGCDRDHSSIGCLYGHRFILLKQTVINNRSEYNRLHFNEYKTIQKKLSLELRILRNLKIKKIQVLSRSLNYVTFLYPFHYKTRLQQWHLISDGIQLYHFQTHLSHLVSSSTGGLSLLARKVRSFRAFISKLRHKHTMLRLKK